MRRAGPTLSGRNTGFPFHCCSKAYLVENCPASPSSLVGDQLNSRRVSRVRDEAAVNATT